MVLPSKKMTWVKFAADVLPAACRLEWFAGGRGNYPFFGLITAVHEDAPPILQWDGVERPTVDGYVKADYPGLPSAFSMGRNPVSWYHWHGGSPASGWGLEWGWVNVTAITPRSCHWQRPELFQHHGEAIQFHLEGAVDQKPGGLALFPECLRSEFREARAAIEAFQTSHPAADRELGDANGVAYGRQSDWIECRLRVTDADGRHAEFMIDRWE